ncbi:uncharacterized protein BXZ73DRAFT_87668 [Epithele typhae]|uniref:uncharacterized protein n=1 Tax=Epithele typhae TaxID=378194 RepID=UPI0020076886|nr:uncharacterized protein BXZ73DRAFT_87668 [Epithele typhae]KAH9943318.1 hypothetical protein BXZ73DRAFT_87668 [Epithele typhae]
MTASDLLVHGSHLWPHVIELGADGKQVYAAPYITLSSLRSVAPDGWNLFVHPRGSMYFRHKTCQVVVDEDIRLPTLLASAEAFCALHAPVRSGSEIEAYMAAGVEASVCLFINHHQCMASFDYHKLSHSALMNISVDVFLRYRRLYWNFVLNHPSHRPCHSRGPQEAIDALRSYLHDHLIYGRRNIAPFSQPECQQLLEILQPLEIYRLQDSAELSQPSVSCLVGWVLKDVYSYRSGLRYGQLTWPELRSYLRTMHEGPGFAKEPPLITAIFLRLIINGLCFGIPSTYLAHVKKASEFRGHLVGLRKSWEDYTRQLVQEYSDFVLVVSTVYSTSTVSLLSIGDIQVVAQSATLLSAFAALGSTTVGVFFVWRHQRNTQMPSSFTYLHNARTSALGLSGHAIILSLPPVLLVWSIITFAVAVLAYTLQNLIEVPASSWVVICGFVMVVVAIIVGVYTFSTIWTWQGQEPWWRYLCCWPRHRRKI